MQIKRIIILPAIILVSIVSYYFGVDNGKSISAETEKLEAQKGNALLKHDFSSINPDEARKLLTPILDAAKIPHGDLSVPGNSISSKRYIISQWQRVAVGSIIIVFGKDKDGDLSVALGVQRGTLRNPQGYMEAPLPRDDLSGIREKNGSRINAKTGEAVPADQTLEENAVREVREEIGLAISLVDLNLLGILSLVNESPVAIAAEYYVNLDNTPALNTIDDEFSADDIQSPRWVKIKDIKFNAEKKKFFAPGSEFPVEDRTIRSINKALEKLARQDLIRVE